jgi:tetratricopeptide (TPR) repeat protein
MYMSSRSSEPQSPATSAARELEALVEAAQQSKAPPVDALHARRMVRDALNEASERALYARRRLRTAMLAVAAALLVYLGSYAHNLLRSETEVAVAARGRPLRLALKTGDALVLAPAAQLRVLSEKPALRRVRLTQGGALFDVTRRSNAQRFEVETPHMKVRVRGTVFTVQVNQARSVVRVHEGSVWVGERVMNAGEVFSSDGRESTSEGSPEQVLAAEVHAAVVARSAAAPAASVPPAPPPAPPVVPTVADASGSSPSPPSEAQPTVRAPQPAVRAPSPAPKQGRSELEHLGELLRAGRANDVITHVRERAQDDQAFLLLLADALRADGRFAEARAEYETLAERARGPTRAQAAFAAAQIALLTLHEPARALHCIEHFAISREDPTLSERSSALQVDALLQLGRDEEARAIAGRYLSEHPETEASERMRQILRDGGAQ